ncbi:MAG: Cof-type HAD-IIB family hydrolase [Tenericutes bacterium]|jgi:Cof subfamily protein (haloacid dehalogenase superfamily)|nr:Cof-type HAD-IIB family hydrolase [Mycoplasmatota bacterium]
MTNNKQYLIVLDLDGTVLYDFDSISQTLCGYIKKLQNDGHKVVIATGRPYRSSKFIYDAFGLDTPIINYNGSLIQHPTDKNFKTIDKRIDRNIIFDIFNNNKDLIRNAFSELNDDIYLFRKEKAIEPLLHADNATNLTIGDFETTIPDDINGMIIIGKQGTGEEIKGYVDEKFNGIVNARIWNTSGEYDSILEIFAPSVNKGNAIEIVSQYLGFTRDQIIAIGDGHNDIELLKYAGLGVAMKNSHPELLKVADKVLEHTSSEDAVFRFLNEYLDNEKDNF